MLEFKCICDKCGFWVTVELSAAKPTCEMPEGFHAVTTPRKEYIFCNSCHDKLQEIMIATIDEFAEEGEKDV